MCHHERRKTATLPHSSSPPNEHTTRKKTDAISHAAYFGSTAARAKRNGRTICRLPDDLRPRSSAARASPQLYMPNPDKLTESAGVAFAGRTEVASAGIHWMPFTTPCAVW